jgi:signal transduction histidine kinase
MAREGTGSPAGQAPRLKREMDTLVRVNRFIASVTDLHELLRLVLRESEQLLDAEASTLFLYDDVNDELYFEIVLGDPEVVKKIQGVRVKVAGGHGFAAECAQSQRPINVPDAQQDPRHNKAADKLTGFTTRAVLAVPLVHQDQLIGVLEVLNRRRGGAFNDEDLRVMEIIANQAAVAIRNARLIESNIHHERLAAMGTAMAGISHGIKNILAGVQGSASLIEFSLSQDPVNLGMIRETWPILKRNEKRISDLIQDMLLYSKRREPDLMRSSVTDLLKEVYDLCLERSNLAGVALERSWPEDDLLWTALEAESMHDCVLNLVSNAIEATPSGDGAMVHLSGARSEDGKHIVIRVRDNGTGIPGQILKKIWEPFFSTKGKRGTGLGLAMTRKTVEEHGGQIAVVSTEGEGTMFTISLPVRDVPEAAATGADEQVESGPGARADR